jgi:hypothetical protein
MLRGGWLALAPQCGQPVLETSFPTAFQRLDIRDGDLGVSLPRNQAKRRAGGWVLQKRNEFRDAFWWLLDKRSTVTSEAYRWPSATFGSLLSRSVFWPRDD